MALPAERLSRMHGLVQPNMITEGITGRQLSRILKDAAIEAEKLIASNLAKNTIGGRVRAAQLGKAVAGLGEISTELWTGVGKVTQAGMYQAAKLAADQVIDRDFFLGMPGKAILQYADQVHFEAAHSVESLISRRTDGVALKDRIYANGRAGVKRAGVVVERGLALQKGHREIAKDVRHLFDPNVPGGTSYAAKRLARTEINNAHHSTTIRLGQDRPWVQGFKWNLSKSHPRPDACDTYADRIFSKQDAPSKPHPQCLCYLTHVQDDPDEFMDNLVNGKYDNWMDEKGVVC